jgi:hypothetical protein
LLLAYQCKSGSDHPTKVASAKVPLSVWVEGTCRSYRRQDASRSYYGTMKKEKRWTMLGASNEQEILGISISEALPQDPVDNDDLERPLCLAETFAKALAGFYIFITYSQWWCASLAES